MHTMTHAAKRWCFTINNPDAADEKELEALQPLCSYMVLGKETGKESSLPHCQGYLELHTKLRMAGLKKRLSRAHLEAARGTPQQAADYCKKDGIYLEFGELGTTPQDAGGAANARMWELTRDAAKQGRFDDIPAKILIQHYSALRRIRQDYQQAPPDADAVCGLWYYGPPMTGKSTAARAVPGTRYDKPCNKWWDGYQGEDNVILDDFDHNHKALGHHLKRWADKYAFPAEMKGTTIQIRPKLIIVTSNYSIDDIFADDPVLADALKRRFKRTHYDKLY